MIYKKKLFWFSIIAGFVGGFLAGSAGSSNLWINSFVGGIGALVVILLLNSFFNKE